MTYSKAKNAARMYAEEPQYVATTRRSGRRSASTSTSGALLDCSWWAEAWRVNMADYN